MSKLSVLVREKFKVKIKSLADESRTIRGQVKALGKEWKKAAGPREGQWEWQSDRYKIAVAQTNLNDHRIGVVRFESRHTLLAYAFLRGVPYEVVERGCLSEPSVKDIVRIIGSLAGKIEAIHRQVEEWLAKRKAKAA